MTGLMIGPMTGLMTVLVNYIRVLHATVAIL